MKDKVREEEICKGALLVPRELWLVLWVDLKTQIDAEHFENFKYFGFNFFYKLTKTGDTADKAGEEGVKWKSSHKAAVDKLNTFV